MNSADLTAEQLATLLRNVQSHVDYLQSLLTRIEQQQFPALDPLRLRTLGVLDQIEQLSQLLKSLANQRTHFDNLMAAKSTREHKRIWRDQRNG